MKKNRGFTLIELLVVIAIIGILSSVVLAIMNGVRGKASDSKVKSQLKSMMSQAPLYSGVGSAVSASECNTTNVKNLFESTTTVNGLGNLFKGIDLSKTRCASSAGIPSNGSTWAVAATLSDDTIFCVDSSGRNSTKDSHGNAYGTLEDTINIGTTNCL